MLIVDFFYELAREHILIKGFKYDRNANKGAGNDIYPLLWLDDPISGVKINDTIQYTCNVDILGIPSTVSEVPTVQSSAFDVGLSLAERIKVIRPTSKISLNGFNFLSLREYTDDNAAGYRFTFTLISANPTDRCAEYFDPEKVFPVVSSLPSFSVADPNGCAVFNDTTGLPNFSVDI